MNIETLKWDPLLCRFFDIPQHILPEIRSSAEVYGCISDPEILARIPIAGVSVYIYYRRNKNSVSNYIRYLFMCLIYSV